MGKSSKLHTQAKLCQSSSEGICRRDQLADRLADQHAETSLHAGANLQATVCCALPMSASHDLTSTGWL